MKSVTGFRKLCTLSRGEGFWLHLKDVCLFVALAPASDLELLRIVLAYPNTVISSAASKAFGKHLWYLSEVLVAFSFFDDNVDFEEKKIDAYSIQKMSRR